MVNNSSSGASSSSRSSSFHSSPARSQSSQNRASAESAALEHSPTNAAGNRNSTSSTSTTHSVSTVYSTVSSASLRSSSSTSTSSSSRSQHAATAWGQQPPGLSHLQHLRARGEIYGTYNLGNGRRGAISGPSSSYYDGKYDSRGSPKRKGGK